MDPRYAPLFQPIVIGSMTVKNRISMSPMYTRYATAQGEVTDRMIAYFAERARGGVGMIVVENTCTDWELGRVDGCPITLHDDAYKHGMHELASAIQRHGVRAVTELQHAGRQTLSSNIDGRQPVGPSAIQVGMGGDMPRAMTEEEIEKAIQDYADAARRTKECGFDAVELHAAHGYLISEFISPASNQRTDKWGGSFENRCRFPVEVVKRIRGEVGPNFPILFRFSVTEWLPDTLTMEEGLEYAKVLERASVDCLDVSGGFYDTKEQYPMQGEPADKLVSLAEAVKKAVSIPVIAVGSLGFDPGVATSVVKDGRADMVHFGRELIADPHLPNKIRAGRFDRARRCIRCMECMGCINRGWSVACAINGETGFEYRNLTSPAPVKKNVVIVGGGPAGLECAVTAARRGHAVTLFEKEDAIGGLARIGCRTEYKSVEIESFLGFYKTMLDELGVTVKLGAEATPETVAALKPDQVIVATGAVPIRPGIPGIEKTVEATSVLLNDAEGIGEEVCVIGGSGVGIDVAIFLTDRGKKVTVLEMTGAMAHELAPHLQWHVTELADKKGVTMLTGHKVTGITGDKITVDAAGQSKEIACDSVVNAVGFTRVDTSAFETAMEKAGIPCRAIGPMDGAGKFLTVVAAGFHAGAEI